MTDIINAAPMVIDLGIQDLSARMVPQSPLNIPQHLPVFHIFAEKGPIGRTYIDFDQSSLTQIYGDSTFDFNSKYFTHQTLFLQKAAANANNCVVHRLLPTDAKDVANLSLWLDVLPTQVPVYEKASDGALVMVQDPVTLELNPKPMLDGSNQPIMVPGYKVAWVVKSQVANYGEYAIGQLNVATSLGLQTDGATQSTQYPIFEFSASTPGEAGNRLAIKLTAAKESDAAPFPSPMLSEGKTYPYYFSMAKMSDPISSRVVPIIHSMGGVNAYFSAKKGAINPATGIVTDLNKITKDLYINVPANIDTGLGGAHTYSANLETVLGMFYNAEKAVADIHRDTVINSVDNNLHAFNFVGFTSSNGSPYQAVKLDKTVSGSTVITSNTNLYMDGSSDGTISETLLDTLVEEDMANYANPLHEYNDLVMNPESIIYDSGYTLKTKLALLKFISRRKDTFVVLGTYSHDAPLASISEHHSLGISLKTAVELYPESATFGTKTARASMFMDSGEHVNSPYDGRISMTYEFLDKASAFMGAKNGAWKNGFCFDKAPLSIVKLLKNINVTWVPTSVRNTLWSVGLNFVLNYKVRQQFFPAMQTVYEDDTSVLNSVFTAMACSYINKIQHAAWREFSGATTLTDAQFEEQVDNFIADRVKDKFDGMFVVIPETKVTERDAIRGYSWTSGVKLYANGSKTVQTAYTSAFRMSDLAA